MVDNVTILGAGIAGVSVGHHLRNLAREAVILEKDDAWGGLIGNFRVGEFLFDKFIHLSFTKDEYVLRILRESGPYFEHDPRAGNYGDGYWLKHPVQANLFPLPAALKAKLILDFIEAPKAGIANYEDWLRAQFGDAFAERYPLRYTRKYWTREAADLGTGWVGDRVHRTSLEQVLFGAMSDETPNYYYADKMRYPERGGYKSFFNALAEGLDIRCRSEVVAVDLDARELSLSDGRSLRYEILVNTIPLPALCRMVKDVPANVLEASEGLDCTSGCLVSLGTKGSLYPDYLWYYIYDEDVPPARVYYPSSKSPMNAPPGHSSLQAEIYFSRRAKPFTDEGVGLERVLRTFSERGMVDRGAVVAADARTVEWANIIFDHGAEKRRAIVLDYLESKGVIGAGRFGTWSYLWSDQSLLSGKRAAERIVAAYS